MDDDLDNQIGDRKDAAANPYSDTSRAARNLRDREQNAAANPSDGSRQDRDNQPTRNIDSAKAGEQQAGSDGGWNTNVTKPQEKPRSLRERISGAKKKSATITIISSLLFGGGLIGGGFFTAFGPIGYMANVMQDLNSQVSAMDVSGEHIARNRVPREDQKEALAGCTFLSMRCKFKTISPKQVLKFKSQGIEVTGETYRSVSSLGRERIRPTSYKFKNVDMDPERFYQELRGKGELTGLRLAYKDALNMSYLGLNDSTMTTRVLKRFGITRQPPELTGSHESRVSILMNHSNTADIDNLKFLAQLDADGHETGKFLLDGDPSGQLYDQGQVDKMKNSIDRVKVAARPPSQASRAVLKGMSALGYYDLACTVKNLLGTASVGAKIATKEQLIQYSAPVMASVYKIKAGDATPEDAQVVGEFFSNPDNRKEIVDLAQSVKEGEDGSIKIDDTTVPMKANPDYGKNVMDGEFYQLSTYGDLPHSEAGKSFSLGFGRDSLLAGVSGAAMVSNAITNLGTDNKICNAVQKWYVRGAGLVIAGIAAVYSGGGTVAAQIAITAGFIVAITVLDHALQAALGGSVITDTMDEAPADRGAALWTGTAALTGEAAQARGLVPGDADDIMAYQVLQNQSNQDYIALERQGVQPFDITNPYSFISSFVGSIKQFMPATLSSAGIMQSIPSTIVGGFSSIINPNAAYAKTLNPERFKKCDDDSYRAIGIDADVQCNIRYIMPVKDLELEVDDVARYMEDNGYVEKDTTTGFPKDYTPPDPVESQNFAKSMLAGFKSSFISSRGGMYSNKEEDYAKFLDYCVYRTLPFGETFEEQASYGSAEPGWINGKNCMKKGAPYSYFRIYTLNKSVLEASDGDDDDIYVK